MDSPKNFYRNYMTFSAYLEGIIFFLHGDYMYLSDAEGGFSRGPGALQQFFHQQFTIITLFSSTDFLSTALLYLYYEIQVSNKDSLKISRHYFYSSNSGHQLSTWLWTIIVFAWFIFFFNNSKKKAVIDYLGIICMYLILMILEIFIWTQS